MLAKGGGKMSTLAEKLVERYLSKSLLLAEASYKRLLATGKVEGVKAAMLGVALADGMISGKNDTERKIQVDAILESNKVWQEVTAASATAEYEYWLALAEVKAAEAMIELQNTPAAQMEA